ncbi:TVP38/TMEM64 family protein [Corticicoccus populi]|uniref:TVP38/TMEM64 family membrane protein n=1 Tax=Corticicoccus populi TaxID=1812821 RepID=A0ABW5WY22_9STAP
MERLIELLTTREGLEYLFEQFGDLGIITGLLLVVLEAFLPILPLFAIVVININSFGIIVGFLISYGGTVLGSYLVFLVIRYFFRARAQRYIMKHEKLQRLLKFIDERGFSLMFIFLALPFTPTAVVNVVAALSNIKKKAYLLILIAAKLIMILSMSFVGHDVTSFFESPVRLIISLVFLVLLYLFSKWYQSYINRKIKN